MLQLLSSKGLGGLGTVKKALTGGDFKRVLTYLKNCMREFYVQKLNISMYLNIKPSKIQTLAAIIKVIAD